MPTAQNPPDVGEMPTSRSRARAPRLVAATLRRRGADGGVSPWAEGAGARGATKTSTPMAARRGGRARFQEGARRGRASSTRGRRAGDPTARGRGLGRGGARPRRGGRRGRRGSEWRDDAAGRDRRRRRRRGRRRGGSGDALAGAGGGEGPGRRPRPPAVAHGRTGARKAARRCYNIYGSYITKHVTEILAEFH